MTEHDIKVQPQFWPDVRDGNITAQLRINDRAYAAGDILLLREHNPSFGYTGDVCRRRVSHVLHSEDLPNGCPRGWVVLSMQPLPAVTDECDCGAEPYKDASPCRAEHLADCPALGNAELDTGVPNHDDPTKRGFNPQ